MIMSEDVLAWVVILAFVIFIIGPVLPMKSGEPYWKCLLMGNAAIALVLLFAGAVMALIWAIGHVAGLS